MIRAIALLASFAGCAGSTPSRSDGDPAILVASVDQLALVVASDDVSGAYAVVDLERLESVRRIELTHGDVMLRVSGGMGYVINRLSADNVQVVDPAQRFATVAQWSVGPGSNPSDLVVVPGAAGARAFVPLYQWPEVAIHALSDGRRLGAIDLSELADDDGQPELAGAAVAPDGRVLVTAQRLDWKTFTSQGAALVAVIDPATDSLVDAFELRLPNPALPPVRLDDGDLLLTAWDKAIAIDNGGVERVRATPPYSSEILLTEERVGGTITALASRDGDTLFLVAHIGDLSQVDTVLFRYVVSADALDEVLRLDGFSFGDIALTDGGLLLVCDRSRKAPGLRVYDAETLAEITTTPIDTGLPPLRVAPLVSAGATG